MRRAVFLDRDNTVIANCGDLGDPERVVLLPGAGEAVATLRDAGFTLVVVTNQGGVARGRYDDAAVHAVHDRLATLLNGAGARPPAIEAFYYCPYHPEGTVAEYRREHPWRKPAPGMLLQAAADLGLDLASSWLIGDAPARHRGRSQRRVQGGADRIDALRRRRCRGSERARGGKGGGRTKRNRRRAASGPARGDHGSAPLGALSPFAASTAGPGSRDQRVASGVELTRVDPAARAG